MKKYCPLTKANTRGLKRCVRSGIPTGKCPNCEGKMEKTEIVLMVD